MNRKKMPLANHDTHCDKLGLDVDVSVVSAAPRVLVALLLRTWPVKHEREVPLVKQVEGDDLTLELSHRH